MKSDYLDLEQEQSELFPILPVAIKNPPKLPNSRPSPQKLIEEELPPNPHYLMQLDLFTENPIGHDYICRMLEERNFAKSNGAPAGPVAYRRDRLLIVVGKNDEIKLDTGYFSETFDYLEAPKIINCWYPPEPSSPSPGE